MKFGLSAVEKEWIKVEKNEQTYLKKNTRKQDSKLNQFLEDKVPAGLQTTLDNAFAKAFHIVFDKGTEMIEKTYKKEDLENAYKINEYTMQLKENKKTVKAFSKKASDDEFAARLTEAHLDVRNDIHDVLVARVIGRDNR